MPSAIQPLSEVPRPRVLAFLQHVLHMPLEVAEWKYYDQRFNAGRERGFVWLKDDHVEGMLGLIPTRFLFHGTLYDMMWTCDWVLKDPAAAPGMGILLLKRVLQSFDHVFGFAGNENTRRISPRLATHTLPHAGISFHRPLRAGILLQKLSDRLPGPLRLDRLPLLPRLPLSVRPRPMPMPRAEACEGIAPNLQIILEQVHTDGSQTAYDREYLDWQLNRCPVLECGTVLCCENGAPRAAVVFWARRSDPRRFRLALWSGDNAADALSDAIRTALYEIQRRSGWLASALVSHRDTRLIAALQATGFRAAAQRVPLSIFVTRPGSCPVDDLGGLNHLATDLAYRF